MRIVTSSTKNMIKYWRRK